MSQTIQGVFESGVRSSNYTGCFQNIRRHLKYIPCTRTTKNAYVKIRLSTFRLVKFPELHLLGFYLWDRPKSVVYAAAVSEVAEGRRE
jgi:hypothetical protein